MPDYIGKNKPGMQAGAELDDTAKSVARSVWLDARDSAIAHARQLHDMGVHKQVVNRLLEPWMHITIIVTAVEWNNVWALRCHEKAEPHFKELAERARAAMQASTPRLLLAGMWHMPLVNIDEDDEEVLNNYIHSNKPAGDQIAQVLRAAMIDPVYGENIPKLVPVSVGRCARVSYLTHEGKRDSLKDVQLHDELILSQPMHASPAEHCAMALGHNAKDERHGKLVGWYPYRMMLPNEHVSG